MKRTYDSSRYIAFFVKAGLIAAIAAVLLAPTTSRASGSEASPRIAHTWPMLKRTSFDPLPPIPHLETMPWLVRQRTPTGFKIDTLLGPTFELQRRETASGEGPRPVNTSQARDLSSSV